MAWTESNFFFNAHTFSLCLSLTGKQAGLLSLHFYNDSGMSIIADLFLTRSHTCCRQSQSNRRPLSPCAALGHVSPCAYAVFLPSFLSALFVVSRCYIRCPVFSRSLVSHRMLSVGLRGGVMCPRLALCFGGQVLHFSYTVTTWRCRRANRLP